MNTHTHTHMHAHMQAHTHMDPVKLARMHACSVHACMKNASTEPKIFENTDELVFIETCVSVLIMQVL